MPVSRLPSPKPTLSAGRRPPLGRHSRTAVAVRFATVSRRDRPRTASASGVLTPAPIISAHCRVGRRSECTLAPIRAPAITMISSTGSTIGRRQTGRRGRRAAEQSSGVTAGGLDAWAPGASNCVRRPQRGRRVGRRVEGRRRLVNFEGSRQRIADGEFDRPVGVRGEAFVEGRHPTEAAGDRLVRRYEPASEPSLQLPSTLGRMSEETTSRGWMPMAIDRPLSRTPSGEHWCQVLRPRVRPLDTRTTRSLVSVHSRCSGVHNGYQPATGFPSCFRYHQSVADRYSAPAPRRLRWPVKSPRRPPTLSATLVRKGSGASGQPPGRPTAIRYTGM